MPRNLSAKEKVRKGNTSNRKITKDLIKVPPEAPDPPPYLKSPEAIEEWNRLVPILLENGSLSKNDGNALGLLCETYALIQTCLEKIQTEGPTFKSPNGHICQRPEVAMLDKQQSKYWKMLTDLGMTPKGRSNMKVPVKGDDGQTPKEKQQSSFNRFFGHTRASASSG